MSKVFTSSGVFDSLSRRGYWVGIGLIMFSLILLALFTGAYRTKNPEENMATQITSNDPLSTFLYSPIGNVVVLAVLQFIAANILLWVGVWVWVWLRLKRLGKRDAPES